MFWGRKRPRATVAVWGRYGGSMGAVRPRRGRAGPKWPRNRPRRLSCGREVQRTKGEVRKLETERECFSRTGQRRVPVGRSGSCEQKVAGSREGSKHWSAGGAVVPSGDMQPQEPEGILRVFSGYSLGGFRVPTGCLPYGLRVFSGYSEGGLKAIQHSSLNTLHSPRHPGSISIRNSENGGLRIRGTLVAVWYQHGPAMVP